MTNHAHSHPSKDGEKFKLAPQIPLIFQQIEVEDYTAIPFNKSLPLPTTPAAAAISQQLQGQDQSIIRMFGVTEVLFQFISFSSLFHL